MSTIPSPQPDAVPARARPPLRVVAPQSRPHKGAVFAMAMVLVFIALLGNAVLSSVLVTKQQRLDRINALVSDERAQQQRLRLEVAQLESPERIVDAAEADGMVHPDSVTWLGPQDKGDVLDSGVPDTPAPDPPVDERAADLPAGKVPPGDLETADAGTDDLATGESAADELGTGDAGTDGLGTGEGGPDELGTGESATGDTATDPGSAQQDALGAPDANGSTGQ